jgi:hypothetical protein
MLDAQLRAEVRCDAVELVFATDADPSTGARELLSQIVVCSTSASATVRSKVREASVAVGDVRVIDHTAGGTCYPLVVSTVTHADAYRAASASSSAALRKDARDSSAECNALVTRLLAERAGRGRGGECAGTTAPPPPPLFSATASDMSSVWQKRSDPNATLFVINAALSRITCVLTTRYVHTLLLFATTGPIIEEVIAVVDIVKSRGKEVSSSRSVAGRTRSSSQARPPFALDVGTPLRSLVPKLADAVEKGRAALLRCDATLATLREEAGTEGGHQPILTVVVPLNSTSKQALVLTADTISAAVGGVDDGAEGSASVHASVSGIELRTYAKLRRKEDCSGGGGEMPAPSSALSLASPPLVANRRNAQPTKLFSLFHANRVDVDVTIAPTNVVALAVQCGVVDGAISAHQLAWIIALLKEENLIERSADFIDPAGVIAPADGSGGEAGPSRKSSRSLSTTAQSPMEVQRASRLNAGRSRSRGASTTRSRAGSSARSRAGSKTVGAGAGGARRGSSKRSRVASVAPGDEAALLAALPRSSESAFDFAVDTLAELKAMLAQHPLFAPHAEASGASASAATFVRARVGVRSARLRFCDEFFDDEAAADVTPRARASQLRAEGATVSFLLFTVIFYANSAYNLTRSP